jgi:hypothetical protein
MLERFRASVEKAEKTKEKFTNLAHHLLEQVSQSEDEVSKVLAGIFAEAVPPNDDELLRARKRKELGNPPGKTADPLGDQLSWEQILTQCRDKRRLWIITNDKDYATEYDHKLFLNAALYQDLARVYGSVPEAYCFDNILDGLAHFARATGVKAEKLPTPQEIEQIKKEQESLPPLDWLGGYDDAALFAILSGFGERDSTFLRAALSSQFTSEEAFPPPQPNKDDKSDT